MDAFTFGAFGASARAQGFDEVLERRWQPGTVLDTHAHAFVAKALVVQGDMWLRVGEQTRHLLIIQSSGECDGGEPGRMQDFVGVRVSNAAEQPWIGERPLERVLFSGERRAEVRQGRLQRLKPATVLLLERHSAFEDVQ